MRVDFPKETDPVVMAKAAAQGFGDDVTAYLLHLVEKDDAEKTPVTGKACTFYEAAKEGGLLLDGGSEYPSDLSTNPAHVEGCGQCVTIRPRDFRVPTPVLCERLSATVYRSSKLRLFPSAEAAL